MRYKITYGPDDKRDKWGHTIKAATGHVEYVGTLAKAEQLAVFISKAHKKWTVCVYDTQGPQEDPEDPMSSLWLVVAYEKGVAYRNANYTKAINNNH